MGERRVIAIVAMAIGGIVAIWIGWAAWTEANGRWNISQIHSGMTVLQVEEILGQPVYVGSLGEPPKDEMECVYTGAGSRDRIKVIYDAKGRVRAIRRIWKRRGVWLPATPL